MSRVLLKSSAVTVVCTLVFVVLLVRLHGFVLDDAFITYRYAEHLASGHGLVWNVGEDPVEGYTSFLWVTANALAIFCGLDPIVFSKVFSTFSALGVVWALAFACRRTDPSLGLILTGGVALSPLFAFLVMQGMETALVALLLLAAAGLGFEVTSNPSRASIGSLCGVAFAAGLARPDSFAFLVGLFLGLLAFFVLQRRHAASRRLALAALVFAVPGSLYMVWRVRYFGYFFPNTFYIKLDRGATWIKLSGVEYAASFLVEILLPYLLLAGLLLAAGLRGEGRATLLADAFRATPILFGALLHGLYLLTLVPIQGFFWRYAFPVFPAFLYAVARIFPQYRPEPGTVRRVALHWLAVAFFVAWNLRFLPEVSYHEKYRTQHDRVAVGRALAGTEATMLTTAAGAVPYYSGWKAVDTMGLVSEEVAHHGVSAQLLQDLDPDLVVFRSPWPEKLVFKERSHRATEEYMLSRGYFAVAAVHRSFGYHLYLFVRQDSPLFDELARRLLSIEDVTYGDLAVLMADSEIPVYFRDVGRDGRD
jgi:arabinofuranosyltransferase